MWSNCRMWTLDFELRLVLAVFRWKRPVGAMLMKALPRHSKAEARLESYFHIGISVSVFFSFFLGFATLFKFLKPPECSFVFHFFKSILQWTLIFKILFTVLFDSSCVYFAVSRWFCLLYLAVFSRRIFQEASVPNSLRRWSWRWLLEAMATQKNMLERNMQAWKVIFNRFTTLLPAQSLRCKTTRRRETCVCTMPLEWHEFDAFSCFAASLLPGRPLFGANCLHAAWLHQVDFLHIFFSCLLWVIFQIRVPAQGQTTSSQVIR